MDWQALARRMIAEIHDSLPADATLDDRKKALRAAAWRFHQGTSWGKKTWSKRCREYLEKHGLPKLQDTRPPPLFADDIIFPYRKAPDDLPHS